MKKIILVFFIVFLIVITTITKNEEIKINPPSRSAKLRFAIRSDENFTEPKELKNKFQKYLNLEELNVKQKFSYFINNFLLFFNNNFFCKK